MLEATSQTLVLFALLVLVGCCSSNALAGHDASVTASNSSYMQVLHWDARIYFWKNFLTAEECDHIIKLGSKSLERSGVVDTDSGKEATDDIRTSWGTFLERGEDQVVEAVERRVAEWSLLPPHYAESMQILRYQPGQEYRAHWDYFFHKEGTENGGNRYATVLIYLTTVEKGGETVFPKLAANNDDSFSECARHRLAVKPRKGDALLFHSMHPDGTLEDRSMHAACPVIEGVKWSATKWIHAFPYNSGDDVFEREYQAERKRHQPVPGEGDEEEEL